ncbi:MAG: hypothetical protein AAGC99_08690 [Pseudomonadota bacterium]
MTTSFDFHRQHPDRRDIPVCRSKAPKIRHGEPDLRRAAAAGVYATKFSKDTPAIF